MTDADNVDEQVVIVNTSDQAESLAEGGIWPSRERK